MPGLPFGAKIWHASDLLMNHKLQAFCRRLLVTSTELADNAEPYSDILVQPLRTSATSRARASPCFFCSLYPDLLPRLRFPRRSTGVIPLL